MVSNLMKKYVGLVVLLICAILALKEIAQFVSPPCINSLNFTLTTINTERSSRRQDHMKIPSEVIIKLDGKAKPQPLSAVANQYSDTFTGNRLKIWFGGRCIDADDDNKELTVAHCNPDWEQTFSLTAEGKLIHDPSGKCAALNKNKLYSLNLVDCEEGMIFNLFNNSFIRSDIGGRTMCISPTVQTDIRQSNRFTCLNVPVALTPCHEEDSRIELIEESFFLSERKTFKDTVAPSTGSCTFKACGLNPPVKAVEMLKPLFSIRCKKVFDCVTVVTKTARRPYLVMRLAKSIRDKKGYDLRIIAYDDGPNDYPKEVWDDMKEYPFLQYMIGESDDMGISLGRNLALKMVKTKYFLLVDDDHVFNDKSNLDKMIEILDTTDATLVGGKFEGFMKFAGALRFGNYHGREEFAIFSGHCDRNLTKWGCEQCDSTSNIFMAKTQPVLEIGGWSEELLIAEHADFFVKMKAVGNKIVYCDDIEVINQQETPEERSKNYQKLRYDMGRKNRMFRLMNARYNVNGLFWCSKYEVVEETQELKCLETKHKIGYC
ncbi:uncharacterized protein LOC134824255 [Bolinopsis microptera]|uniref:uncharacterized protein LOC134824255 n=1 Tax=Bolinopsis microptera TaxID=2820187 RepID=UPI00307AE176